MDNKFVYLLKKSSAFRFFIFFLLIAFFGGVYILVSNIAVKRPQIADVEPAVITSGNQIRIRGNNFGQKLDYSWIQIGDTMIQSEFCDYWTNSEIKVEIPEYKKEGILYVVVQNKKSNPVFITSASTIPIVKDSISSGEAPLIKTLDKKFAEVGGLIKISGENFGNIRGDSQVLFVPSFNVPAISQMEKAEDIEAAVCSEHDFDFVMWSNEELQIRVPDGADSGMLVVITQNGISNPIEFQLKNKIGSKTRLNKKNLNVSAEVAISDVKSEEKNTLFAKVPLPSETYSQNGLKILSITPEPLAKSYQGLSIHQFNDIEETIRLHIRQEYNLNTYEVSTKINPVNVRVNSVQNSALYSAYTVPTKLIPSDDEIIKKRVGEIIQYEKNPYLKAKKIYNYLLDNIEIIPTSSLNSGTPSVDALLRKKADTYDIAILFTALARAAGIPAEPIAGIVADSVQNTFLHWWSEFYLEGFGWVPVDIGMAKNLPFDGGTGEKEKYYFGNLDALRVVFSRGQSTPVPMTVNSRFSSKERNYSFNECWEEFAGIKNYNSVWTVPAIKLQ